MTLGLHNITKDSGKNKKAKKLGRGNSSGKGTYAGKGLKGQRSRSGGKSGLKLKGLRQRLLKLPQNRGMKSILEKPFAVNLDTLNKVFKDQDEVTLKSLVKKGVIKSNQKKIKILARGKLAKKLNLHGTFLISEKAKSEIEKAGGKIELKEKTTKK